MLGGIIESSDFKVADIIESNQFYEGECELCGNFYTKKSKQMVELSLCCGCKKRYALKDEV